MFMRRTLLTTVFMAAILLSAGRPAQAAEPTLQERFEKQVQEYEAGDKASAPPQGAILFAGDSQFFRWKTIAEDLPGYTLINRGIDSFQFPDLLRYFDRLVLPYKPRLIVLHVGGNDVHSGRTPAQVLSDLQAFVTRVHATLPGVHIVYSSITPGPGRWDEAPQRRDTNQALRNYIKTQPDLAFVDLWSAMLQSNGQPRQDIWMPDRVHPNHEGYLIRVRETLPLLGPPH